MTGFGSFLANNIEVFLSYTGFANATLGHLVMILVGLLFIFLAIRYEFEPMLLIPIGFGILIGNIPFKDAGLQIGIYEEGSVLNILYQGVTKGWYPPLIFLGIGAMTDFSALIANPKLMLIGAAAQFGIFGAYILALYLGSNPIRPVLSVLSEEQMGLRLSFSRPSWLRTCWVPLQSLHTPIWPWCRSSNLLLCVF